MNPLLLAFIPGILLGCLNGYYWSKQGYRGWHYYYLGSIVFYVISLMVFKFFE